MISLNVVVVSFFFVILLLPVLTLVFGCVRSLDSHEKILRSIDSRLDDLNPWTDQCKMHCPFCGSSDVSISKVSDGDRRVMGCDKCDAVGFWQAMNSTTGIGKNYCIACGSPEVDIMSVTEDGKHRFICEACQIICFWKTMALKK